MYIFLEQPLIGIGIVLVLAFLDYPLTAIARSSYDKYMHRYVDYQSMRSAETHKVGYIWVIIKLLIAVFLYLIWLFHSKGDLEITGRFYLWLLGFAIASYFLINLRHVESIMLSRLYSQTDSVNGHIAYHSRFSMKISAVQMFSIFIILCLVTVLLPNYFTIGLTCAPLFLATRNLLLS